MTENAVPTQTPRIVFFLPINARFNTTEESGLTTVNILNFKPITFNSSTIFANFQKKSKSLLNPISYRKKKSIATPH